MKLTNIEDLATDEKLSTDGAPLDLGSGRTIWVRRMGGHNREFQYIFARKLVERGAALEKMQPQDRAAMELEIFVEHIVSRWAGFETEEGEAPCTPELVRELFEQCPDIYDRVREKAVDEEAYRLPADCKSV